MCLPSLCNLINYVKLTMLIIRINYVHRQSHNHDHASIHALIHGSNMLHHNWVIEELTEPQIKPLDHFVWTWPDGKELS